MTPTPATTPSGETETSKHEDLAAAVLRMRRQQAAISSLSVSDAFVAGDVEKLAREITEVAAKATGVERANVWLFNEDESQLRCIDLFEATPGSHSSGSILHESEYGPEFASLRGVRFVDADDARNDPRTAGYLRAYLEPLGITSMLDALIEVSGHRLGLLCLEHVNRQHHWERDEVDFACQLADKIALSMVNRARREAQETLRASEERFAGAFEHAPIGVALVSPDGRFLKVNHALCDLVGYPEAELLARTFQDITHPDDLDADLENVRQLLSGRTRSYRMEKRYVHASGRLVTILLSVSLVRTPGGDPEYLIAQIQDISDQKRAQAEIEGALREKQALLREVHHRVKNNLQVITSLLRLESSRREDPGTRLVLREMQGRILSMALLHETLYRTGDFGEIDLASYLKNLAEQLFRAQGSSTGSVSLRIDVTHVSVPIDQAIPCGLIANEMLTNSLKHGFAEGEKGEVTLTLRPEGDSEVHLSVRDNGVGLPKDFETRRARSLGMQLIADLARQLGGRVDIGAGQGAAFTVTFTRGKAHQTGSTPRPLG
jgi:PAS domain S-box-containing protein